MRKSCKFNSIYCRELSFRRPLFIETAALFSVLLEREGAIF
ncbi:hypothetical protein NEIMUCOT_05712 [Neisseria mucosa ATCC 25996]|uniref:Uncharacterized protein n=1 Tax=Neisseria mucosa (strain ATCC 25996 / DSM 4631 / NCTC 10774 / M26) TaxID=546266 RepID=D2ZYK1_NEIM2|nr:hypothetical protein NEIMUCOT_05712 [Neisseria mucosa ATCC 25996]